VFGVLLLLLALLVPVVICYCMRPARDIDAKQVTFDSFSSPTNVRPEVDVLDVEVESASTVASRR